MRAHVYKKDVLKTLGFKFKDLVYNLIYYLIYYTSLIGFRKENRPLIRQSSGFERNLQT